MDTEILALYDSLVRHCEDVYDTYQAIMETRPMYLTGEEISKLNVNDVRYTYHKMKLMQYKRDYEA